MGMTVIQPLHHTSQLYSSVHNKACVGETVHGFQFCFEHNMQAANLVLHSQSEVISYSSLITVV